MAFDKEEYWATKAANIGSVRNKLKPSAVPPKTLEIGFDNQGRPVPKNRAFRRQKNHIGLYTRKGFIIAIRRIRITRKNKSGHVKTKYVTVD